MENNEEFVLTDGTENVEQTTEEIGTEAVEEIAPVKTYSQEELEDIVKKRLQRQERKLRKEYDNKYGQAENVIKAGLEVDSFEEGINQLSEFYKEKGINIPTYHSNDIDEDLYAEAKAQRMINEYSIDEIEEELNSLASKGLDNMNNTEKKLFKIVGDYAERQKSIKELASIGIKEDALEDKEFIEFASNLNPNMSTKDKYEMFTKYRPMPKVEPIGSMKGDTSKENSVKDFYTPEEAKLFSKEDLDKNPELFNAIVNSMYKWNN